MYIGVTLIEHHIVVVGSGSIIGYNDSSWSLNYNGNKYHCSKDVKYCDRSYKSGDLVSVFLDFNMGTIEFAINNELIGVAFNNL